jgi:hypothetical protein
LAGEATLLTAGVTVDASTASFFSACGGAGGLISSAIFGICRKRIFAAPGILGNAFF